MLTSRYPRGEYSGLGGDLFVVSLCRYTACALLRETAGRKGVYMIEAIGGVSIVC